MMHYLSSYRLSQKWLNCTVLLLLLIQVPVSAQLFAKTNQVSRLPFQQSANVSLVDALTILKQKYKVNILFEEKSLSNRSVPSEILQLDKSLEANLTALLRPIGMGFKKKKNNYIILSNTSQTSSKPSSPARSGLENSAPERLLATTSAKKQTEPFVSSYSIDRIVSGKITDESGSGLPGVSVLIKGTLKGLITDAEGKFSIEVPSDDAVLVISFIGYENQEVTVGNRTALEIFLSVDEKGLEEVVVVGYGIQKKRDLTGAMSSISSKEIKSQPTSSLDQSLQGRAAGVQVTQSSHSPGGGAMIRIRGGNSISASNEPLYVIDGFPVSNPGLPAGAVGSGGNQNILATINPNDIESIEVLKDASATAIYGSRGANGVILVTTKRGKDGKSAVDFEFYHGFQKITRMLDVANAQESLEIKNEQLRNLGYGNRYGYTPQYPKLPEEYGEGVNWQKEMYRQAPVQNYQLTFSGGAPKLRYAVSGNYFNQDGILLGSDFKRYSTRVNLDADVTNKLRIGTSITLSKSLTNGVSENESGLIYTTLGYNPANPIRDPNGEYTVFNVGSGWCDCPNPVALAKTSTNLLESDRVLGNLFAQLEILKGLTARVSIGSDILNSRRNTFFTPQTVMNAANTLNGYGSNASINTTNLLNENTIHYAPELNGMHKIDILAGVTFQSSKSVGTYQEAYDFPNYSLGANNLGLANNPRPPSGFVNEWGLNSYLARTNYILKDKYLFTVTGRVDGSSRFGSKHKYGFFPSGAFAWRISNENFLSKNRYVSDAKFRLSYGITGNDGIGLYNSLSEYKTERTVMNDIEILATVPLRIANPDLRWEKTSQLDIGLDVSFFNNRLQTTLDYYIKTTTDLLLNVDLPATTGFLNVTRNIGSMENRGFELSINSVNIDRQLKWTTSGNISFNKNKVLKLADADHFFSGETIVKVGQPVGSFYMTVFDGIWQTQEEINQAGGLARLGDLPGAPRFKDVNGDGVLTASTDRTIVGNGLPKFIFGLTNNLSYKAFDLLVFFQGVSGNKIYNYPRRQMTGNPGTNLLREMIVGAWRPESPSNTHHGVGLWNMGTTSAYIEDGSFLRLKNVSLGYRLPIDSKLIKQARVYVSGQNLLTFTTYKGYDPEVNSDQNSNTLYGFDRYAYPAARTFTVGGNFTF